LIVNYLGSAILMGLLIKAHNNPKEQWWWRPAIGAGFCGGFTTFSTFALEVEQMISKHYYGQAAFYMGASLFGTYVILFIVAKIIKPIAAK
jgi:CrcB protein